MNIFQSLLVTTQVFFLTLFPSEIMPKYRRERTIDLIGKLAEIRGIDTTVSKRCSFTRDKIMEVPRMGGVYKIYEGDQLRYIGVSRGNLRKRLRRHVQRSEDPEWIHMRPLYQLISVGNASFEYYLTPYPGWKEDHELSSCDDPESLYNRQIRGNRLD